jgi:hypothetical protein
MFYTYDKFSFKIEVHPGLDIHNVLNFSTVNRGYPLEILFYVNTLNEQFLVPVNRLFPSLIVTHFSFKSFYLKETGKISNQSI